ncbi:MAG: NADH:flavin oxidoreductase/NADH oxidase [Acidimicrobiales bacterium]
MSALFRPLRLRSLEIPNRCWVSPMCQYSAVDGVVGAWHRVHLGVFATGGAGLIMAEATGVVPEGRISIACPGLWNDAQVEAWRDVVDFVHAQGALIGVQLSHAGRKGSTMAPWADHLIASPAEGGWVTVAPSAVAFATYPTPRALSLDELDELVTAFAAAAGRARAAGFDLIELHAAHGYLLHQFLSPLSNQREDAYGGDLAGRARLLVRVVDAVRETIGPDVPLLVRVSATDWTAGGLDLDQVEQVARWLGQHGVDLIDVSSGGNVANASIPVGPGYQVPFAEGVRRFSGVPTSAVGVITEPDQAEEIVASGRADAVMLARAFLRNPRWALGAAEALGERITWPSQLERARAL